MKDKGLMYQYYDCGEIEIVYSNDHRKDGRPCKRCGGRIIPIGRVDIGVDFASGPDRMAYSSLKTMPGPG